MFARQLTCAKRFEKGTPLSRANDHNCLDVVAVSFKQQHVSAMIMIVTMTSAAALLLVALKKSWMKGYRVGVSTMRERSPRQKHMVTAMMKPMAPLSHTDHMIDIGIVRPASSTSSAKRKISRMNAGREAIRTDTCVPRNQTQAKSPSV
ncbi:MAG: hypothetical protein Q9228_002017 [Teloschistes exilis]